MAAGRGQVTARRRRQPFRREVLEDVRPQAGIAAARGQAVYYSRSRQRLWHKGEESGHFQQVHEMRLDCDADVVLLSVTQHGHDPSIACHTGRHSCFFQRYEAGAWHTAEPVLKDPSSIYK